MKDQFQELTTILDALERDFQKFYNKGNNSAGTRIRVGLHKMKKIAQAIRLDIQERRKVRS